MGIWSIRVWRREEISVWIMGEGESEGLEVFVWERASLEMREEAMTDV